MRSLALILTNYNYSRYLPCAINSVLQQTRLPDEFLIVDDCSTDNSVEIIEQFVQENPWITFIKRKKNMGILYNGQNNHTFTHSDLLFWFSPDDFLEKTFIEKSMALLEEHPQAEAVCSIPVFFQGDDITCKKIDTSPFAGISKGYLSPKQFIKYQSKQRFWIAGHTCIMSKQLFIRSGSFINELKWHSDWFYLLQATFRNGICFLPEPLACMRLHNSSYSNKSKNTDEQYSVIRNLLKRIESSNVKEAFVQSRSLREIPLIYSFAYRAWFRFIRFSFRGWLDILFCEFFRRIWRKTNKCLSNQKNRKSPS